MIKLKSFVTNEEFILPRELPDACLTTAVLLTNRLRIVDRLPKGGRIAEVGTQRGEFAKYILSTSSPTELHLFDLAFNATGEHAFDYEFFRKALEEKVVTLNVGDSSSLLEGFPDKYFDWIYIDGDHSYEGVARDIAVAKRKVVDGGFLVFNDYAIYSPLELTQYGVQRAVNDLIIDDGYRVVYFALSLVGYHDMCVQKVT